MTLLVFLTTILYVTLPSAYFIYTGTWYYSFIFLGTSWIVFYLSILIYLLLGLFFTLFERKPHYLFTYKLIKSTLYFFSKFIMPFKYKVISSYPVIDKEKKTVIIANHKSQLDPIILLLTCPFPISFTPKSDLFKYKILRYVFQKIYCVSINRSDVRETIMSLRTAKENILEKNIKYVIFPEGGTHNKEKEGLYNQKSAAYKIILDTQADILPITIHNALNWKQHKRKQIQVRCHNIISYEEIKDLTTLDIASKMEDVITGENN